MSTPPASSPPLDLSPWLLAHRERRNRAGLPSVTLAYAQSWDGSITLRPGVGLALSSPASTRLTHQLRSLHDGILVGIGTVLADDPQLNVRECPGPSPQPIVLDSQLRIPAQARLCTVAERRCWVLTSAQVLPARDDIDILSLPGDAQGHIALTDALQVLWQRGIRSLMVEGGANVITAFLKARLADCLVLTVAPVLAGGYKAVGDMGHVSRVQLPHIAPLHTERLGDDLIVWGDLHYGPQESGVFS